jgi:hypothetical protein
LMPGPIQKITSNSMAPSSTASQLESVSIAASQ